MKCQKCARRAVYTCGNQCGVAYCGQECQKIDWAVGHMKFCLVEGRKRGHEESGHEEIEPACRNEEDSFTGERFEDIEERDPRLIITLKHDGNCYHLPSMYNWAISLKQARDPYTNEDLSADELAHIKEKAVERFPLKVTFATIGSPQVPPYETTSLESIATFSIGIYNHIGNYFNSLNVDTLFEMISALALRSPFQMMFIREHSGSVQSHILNHETASLYDLGIGDTLTILIQQFIPPPAALRMVQTTIAIAEQHNWPMDAFEQMRRDLNQLLGN
jgi:hypothetical protein